MWVHSMTTSSGMGDEKGRDWETDIDDDHNSRWTLDDDWNLSGQHRTTITTALSRRFYLQIKSFTSSYLAHYSNFVMSHEPKLEFCSTQFPDHQKSVQFSLHRR